MPSQATTYQTMVHAVSPLSFHRTLITRAPTLSTFQIYKSDSHVSLSVSSNPKILTPYNNMKLAIAAAILSTFTSLTFAADSVKCDESNQEEVCIESHECAKHTDWASESGHFTTPQWLRRRLGHGSRIDLRALFGCSAIEDMGKRLACEENLEVRASWSPWPSVHFWRLVKKQCCLSIGY